jgi:hypothetical protein
MARARSTFTEADVKRAINAVRKAGLEVAAVEVDSGGKISVRVGQPSGPSDWDEILNRSKGESPEQLRQLIGAPQPARNLSLRRQPTRAERHVTEWSDWYNNIYKKLTSDEQQKIGREMREEYERASSAAIAALELAPPPRVLVTGSLYLAGEVLAANGTPPA